jgi:hypothetical protein
VPYDLWCATILIRRLGPMLHVSKTAARAGDYQYSCRPKYGTEAECNRLLDTVRLSDAEFGRILADLLKASYAFLPPDFEIVVQR